MKTTAIGKLALLAAILAGAASLGGCAAITALLGGDAPVRDGASDEITEGGTLDVFALKVGDCFDDTSESTVSDLPVVPCSDAHDLEVYAEFSMPEGDFPGDDAITDAAGAQCRDDFETFIGIDYDASTLDLGYLTPTEDSWNDNDDRLVQCYVGDPAGQTTGSLADAAR